MNKKYFFAIAGAILVGTALAISDIPKKLTGGLYTITNNFSSQKSEISSVYKISFIPPKTIRDWAAVYIPVYVVNDYTTAAFLAEKFNMNPINYEETDDSFLFIEDGCTLKVDKFLDVLHFEASDGFDNEAIKAAAEEFMKSQSININYDDVKEFRNESEVKTVFYSKLGNRYNYAFPNIAIFKNGGLVSLSYYYFAYERISNVETMGVKEAAALLPEDYESDVKIDLKKYTPVYFYNNSVIEPGCLFEGEYSNGEEFSHIVPTAIYKWYMNEWIEGAQVIIRYKNICGWNMLPVI